MNDFEKFVALGGPGAPKLNIFVNFDLHRVHFLVHRVHFLLILSLKFHIILAISMNKIFFCKASKMSHVEVVQGPQKINVLVNLI